MTDGQGRYQIVALRPGTYKVTYSLTGFRTVLREGIELTAGFTATVNIQLAVGSVEETITVAGTSPVVDVQSVTTQTVMTREVLDAVPTGRNIQAVGILIPGTGLQVGGGGAYSVDVGGSGGMQQSPLAFHGNTNSVQQVDGIRFNNMEGAGQYAGMYWNDGMVQEIQYTTSGDSAETQSGGVRINMIPKEGGNTFRGSVVSNFTYDSWHSNNLDQNLMDRGLQSVGQIKQIWDFNPTIGGPIKRDTLWFHFAFRNWGVNRTVPGSFSEIDPTRQSVDDSYINSTVLRLTWQMNQKNKFTAFYDRNHKYRGHWGLASTVSEEAAAIEDMPQSYVASVKWTSTITNRLLVEAGLGLYTQQYREIYEPELPTSPGVAVGTFPLTNTRYDPFYENFDESTGYFRGAWRDGNIFHISGVKNYIGSVSYVTGSQSLKVGLQYQDGISRQSDLFRGDFDQIRWNGGLPRSVILRASPRYAVENIRDLGIYVDDRWTFDRVTLSGGLRYDYFNGYAPEQYSEPGTWIGARLTPKVENIPNWRDINPRLGVAWDLLGNGRTALKFTMGRYVNQAVAGPTRDLNPMRQIVSTDTRTWNDANGNLRPELNELGPTSNARFGTVVQAYRVDPEYVDGYGSRSGHWNYHASVQHELRPGLGVTAGYTYITNFNQLLPTARGATQFGRGPDNAQWTPADFDEFTIVVPDDPRLPAEIRGQTVSGLYVIKDAKRPLVDDFRTFAKNFGDYKETYNGADVNVNWRMNGGGTRRWRTDLGRRAHQRLLRRRRPDAAAILRQDRGSQWRPRARRAAGQASGIVPDRGRMAGERDLPIGARARDNRRVDEHHLQQHHPVPRQHSNESRRNTQCDRPVDRAGDAVRRPDVPVGPAGHEDVRTRKHPRQTDGGSLQRAQWQRRAAARVVRRARHLQRACEFVVVQPAGHGPRRAPLQDRRTARLLDRRVWVALRCYLRNATPTPFNLPNSLTQLLDHSITHFTVVSVISRFRRAGRKSGVTRSTCSRSAIASSSRPSRTSAPAQVRARLRIVGVDSRAPRRIARSPREHFPAGATHSPDSSTPASDGDRARAPPGSDRSPRPIARGVRAPHPGSNGLRREPDRGAGPRRTGR